VETNDCSPSSIQADRATTDVLADFVQKYCVVTGDHFEDYIVYDAPASPQVLSFQTAFAAYCRSRAHNAERDAAKSVDPRKILAGGVPSAAQLASAVRTIASPLITRRLRHHCHGMIAPARP
jgi:hypothetical protein